MSNMLEDQKYLMIKGKEKREGMCLPCFICVPYEDKVDNQKVLNYNWMDQNTIIYNQKWLGKGKYIVIQDWERHIENG